MNVYTTQHKRTQPEGPDLSDFATPYRTSLVYVPRQSGGRKSPEDIPASACSFSSTVGFPCSGLMQSVLEGIPARGSLPLQGKNQTVDRTDRGSIRTTRVQPAHASRSTARTPDPTIFQFVVAVLDCQAPSELKKYIPYTEKKWGFNIIYCNSRPRTHLVVHGHDIITDNKMCRWTDLFTIMLMIRVGEQLAFELTVQHSIHSR